MINPEYYGKQSNIVTLENGLRMFKPKQRAIVTKSSDYTVKYGDTYYTLATKLFSQENQHYWTIISDINAARKPDALQVGEIIQLPRIIVT